MFGRGTKNENTPIKQSMQPPIGACAKHMLTMKIGIRNRHSKNNYDKIELMSIMNAIELPDTQK